MEVFSMSAHATHGNAVASSFADTILIADPHDPKTLLRDLASKLQNVVAVQTIQISLYDADGILAVRALDPATSSSFDPETGTAVACSPTEVVWREQHPMLISASKDAARFPKYATWMSTLGLQTEWVAPIASGERRIGAIGFGFGNGHRCSPPEVKALDSITKLYASAWGHVVDLRDAQRTRAELARERDHSRLLLEINNAIASYLDLDELWKKIDECLLKVVPHDFSGMSIYDEDRSALRRIAIGGHTGGIAPEEEFISMEGSAAGFAFKSGKPLVVSPADMHRFPGMILCKSVPQMGFKSGCVLPLVSHGRKVGILSLGSRREGAFGQEQLATLAGVASQVAIAVANAIAHREVEYLKNKLRAEKLYLDEEIQTACDFDIIGNSEAFLRILRQVEVVAPTDSTVLIQGETGSGKEIVARAIHKLSDRRDRTLVKVNCSAIPTGLLESEFFGHEKGAFTGAIARRVGRFELAHQGTLFLDEVGDIPLELQPKLLRVLQEKEIERIGGNRTIPVDVRIVAATNVHLAQMVADKKFRSDLYYRLNVFPITVPPLRERPEDIVPLAQRFAQAFARRMKKPLDVIPPHVQQALTRYEWPGNIRELQNVIERAVILSRSPVLEVPLADLAPVTNDGTLAGTEREYILRVLRETDWLVSGKNGAARRLGLNRSTLQSKMRKLDIRRPE
jgi:formate hydrogenlyase transcriptional activator